MQEEEDERDGAEQRDFVQSWSSPERQRATEDASKGTMLPIS